MSDRSKGGSNLLRVRKAVRPRLSAAEQLTKAKERVTSRLSTEVVGELIMRWNSLTNGRECVQSKEWEKGNGLIMNMLSIGMSEIEIRSLIPVDSSRIQRLRYYDPATAPRSKPPKHALNEESLLFMKQNFVEWEFEEGFPCPHRRLKRFFIEDGMTWKKVHQLYLSSYDKISPERKKP